MDVASQTDALDELPYADKNVSSEAEQQGAMDKYSHCSRDSYGNTISK